MLAAEESHVLIALAAASYVREDVGAGAIVQSLGPPHVLLDIDTALERLASRDLVRDVGLGRWCVTRRGWDVLSRHHAGACWDTEVEEWMWPSIRSGH